MPLYEYECEKCGAVLETYRPLVARDENPPLCVTPSCESKSMKRILSVPAPPRPGGVDGKLHSGKLLRERNKAYAQSPKGIEEHKANVKAAYKRLQPK